MAILFFVLAGVLIWGMYKLIHMSGTVGSIFRLSWNIIMGIFSLIPGLGWCNHFIVTEDEELKETLVREGEKADKETQERWNREKEEQDRINNEEAEKRAKDEEYVRNKIWKETGRTDVQFNSDSSKCKFSDEDWSDAHNVNDI